ncbi:MAG: tetratricopeptide repeat protein [Spirochaetaceae bacterium]|jgi:tetratricopeptide (TPR) repeat protein|nr:tetratricopeptide repeat protein [Spirochaetaceae bacterium]
MSGQNSTIPARFPAVPGVIAAVTVAMAIVVFAGSCASSPLPPSFSPPEQTARTSSEETAPSGSSRTTATSAEILKEAQGLLEIGSPGSLRNALALIEGRALLQSEYGRTLNAVAALLIDWIYPDADVTHGEVNPPLQHAYTKIIADVQKGTWMPPPADSTDYLTNLLPCVVLMTNATADVNNAALPFLEKARQINPKGVLAVYFSALVFERSGRLLDARQLYDEAVTLSNGECYPAFLGIARILARAGRHEDAIALLTETARLYPDNIASRRQLAVSYIAAGEWKKADEVIAAVLARNSRNPEFLLMQARVFIELGRYNQVPLPLDTYIPAGGSGTNRQYLFLRARLAWEGNRSRSAAVAPLRTILAAAPNDVEARIYLTRLLLGSSQPAFKTEGRQLLARLLSEPFPSPEIFQLALEDAIVREAWMEADGYLAEILKNTPSLSGLKSAVTVKNGMGDRTAALDFARNAAALFPDDENTRLDLIGMLVESQENAERDEGRAMIDTALTTLKTATARSRAHYYRSRLRANDEDAVNDLRASLLEDPRNVTALLGLIAIYDKRQDSRRVTFYLQQALVLAPDNPEVTRLRLLYER